MFETCFLYCWGFWTLCILAMYLYVKSLFLLLLFFKVNILMLSTASLSAKGLCLGLKEKPQKKKKISHINYTVNCGESEFSFFHLLLSCANL